MTTTARTWFYAQPEKNAYALAERVRTTLWEARLGDIWLDTVRAESPFLMRGRYNKADVEMEWEPGKWLALRSKPGDDYLVQRMSFVLGRKPTFTYEDVEGRTVTEWHIDGGAKRWQAIQGVPAYRNPRRFNGK